MPTRIRERLGEQVRRRAARMQLAIATIATSYERQRADPAPPFQTARKRMHHVRPLARRAAIIAAAVAFVACGAERAIAQTTPPPATLETVDGRALYDAAYDRWNALRNAPFAVYETMIHIVQRGRTIVRHENVAFRRRDHRCLVVGIALDARDRPDPPMLTERCFAPDSSFTFLRKSGSMNAGPLPLDLATPAAVDEPRTIGYVAARTRQYEATYIADELIATKRTAHLALRPLTDPSKHVLRDMWVDRATGGVVRLHAQAALAARFASVDFTVDFDETATTQVVRRVVGYAKAQVLLVKIGGDFDFTLGDDSYPATLPDWYFEPGGYRAHQSPPLYPIGPPSTIVR